ncbi:hypothetical protein HDV02_006476 [Globomyces sp. JEL0801]|nr:hypothetical protein HDV02_006476 [Globomyces sp. JEL0801]
MLLFSNNLSYISLAIQNLIQTPSNNLKVFVNQSQIENPSLMDSIWSLSDSLSFVDTLALVLYSNSLLDRLKLAQKVFHVDIFRIDALVKSLDTDIPTLDNLLFDHIHNSCQNGLFSSPFLHRSADYLLPEDLSVGPFDLDSLGQNDTLNLLLKAQNTIPNLAVNSQRTALDLPVNNPETHLDLPSKTQNTNLDMSELNQFSTKDFNNTNAAVNKTKNNYNQDEVEVDNVDPKISMESSHIGNTNSSHNNGNADTSHTNKQNVNNETLTEISKFIISQSLKDLSIIITLSTTIPPNHQQYIRTPIHPPTISQITPHSGIIQTNPPIFYELKVIDVDFKSMSKIQKWVDLELELRFLIDMLICLVSAWMERNSVMQVK